MCFNQRPGRDHVMSEQPLTMGYKPISERALGDMDAEQARAAVRILQYQLDDALGNPSDSHVTAIKAFFEAYWKAGARWKKTYKTGPIVSTGEARFISALLDGLETYRRLFARLYADRIAHDDEPDEKILNVWATRSRRFIRAAGFDIICTYKIGYHIPERRQLSKYIKEFEATGEFNFLALLASAQSGRAFSGLDISPASEGTL